MRISCRSTSHTQFVASTHPINFSYFCSSIQALKAVRLRIKISTTRFLGDENFYTMLLLRAMIYCSEPIKTVKPDFLLFTLYTTSSLENLGMVGIFFSLRGRSGYLFSSVVVQVLNRFREGPPVPSNMICLFHSACMA